MAKVNAEMYEEATKGAELKTNKKTSGSKIVQIYDVPLEWVEIVKTKTGFKTMSSYCRNALMEKLKRDGFI